MLRAEEDDVGTADVSRVPAEVLRNVEADTYWCMSRLLDGIQVSPAHGLGDTPASEPLLGHCPGIATVLRVTRVTNSIHSRSCSWMCSWRPARFPRDGWGSALQSGPYRCCPWPLRVAPSVCCR